MAMFNDISNNVSLQLDVGDIAAQIEKGQRSPIRAAIIAACEESDRYASGIIGPAFSTSGPGPGWSVDHDAVDFARRALDPSYGAIGYIDADDGTLATAGEDDEDGDAGRPEPIWTEDSIVCLACPFIEDLDTDASATAVVLMAQAVLDGDHRGIRDEWVALIRAADRLQPLAEMADDLAAVAA